MQADRTGSIRGRGGRSRLRAGSAIAPTFFFALLALPAGAPAQPAASPLTTQEQGWSESERRDFYHRPIGGEMFPLDWSRALLNVRTRRPFLDDLDRFGFLGDPADPDRLPIGLTARAPARSRSPGLASGEKPLRMLGLNCSACHVTEITHLGRAYRIDGAPNVRMDFVAFNAELSESVRRIADFPGDFAAFQLRVVGQPEEAARGAAASPGVLKLLKSLADWDEKDGAHQMADALASALAPMFRPSKSTWPLVGEISVMPPLTRPASLEFVPPLGAIGREAGPTLADFLRANSGPGAPLGVLAPDPLAGALELESLTQQLARHFVQTIWYLKQAAALMAKQDQLRNVDGGTAGGPGRVDDFRLARNLILSNLLMARPASSPTSFPTLWGTDRVRWLGWDANSDSTLQRNIATAIALGGVFDRETGRSSIALDDLYHLEVIGSKVGPPRWPFGPIDPSKAGRGEVLFKKLCASCHVDPVAVPFTPEGTVPDWLPDLLYDPAPASGWDVKLSPDPSRFVGTDPNRALNFVADFPSPPGLPDLAQGLAIFQKLLTIDGGLDAWQARRLRGDRTERWRPTGKYAGRPLIATWAAAPYLHNDSVPTLYDLLQPASKRPAEFRRGSREFDAEKVGYREPAPGEPAFLFDTRLPGNRNIGHEYGTDLADPDRRDLIEYLKAR